MILQISSDVLGGGGVGKSTVINVVTRHCEQVLNKVGDDPNQPRILLLAPTGMAACLIGKKWFIKNNLYSENYFPL